MPRMNLPDLSPHLQRLPRLTAWLFINLVLLACVGAIAPQQLPVSLYKLSLVALAGLMGYWLDRSIFPYGRPDQPDVNLWTNSLELALISAVSMVRRALIVVGAMLAMGLGA